MLGADRRAQALGVAEERLMEHAGTAVAAAVQALAVDTDGWERDRSSSCAARATTAATASSPRAASRSHGAQVVVAVVATEARPRGATAARNWDRIARDAGIAKVHAPVARDVAVFGQGIEKAAVIVDALLGTGVRGAAPRARSARRSSSSTRARASRHPGRRRRHARRRSTSRAASRPTRPSRPT